MTKRALHVPLLPVLASTIVGSTGFVISNTPQSYVHSEPCSADPKCSANPITGTSIADVGSRQLSVRRQSKLSMAGVIDAEIVTEDDNGDDRSGAAATTDPSPKTLVDMVLESAPEWKHIVVEFVDKTPSGNLEVIPCRMPFTVDVDGVTYSIGTPFEDTVAVLTDDADGNPTIVDPDDDDNMEILQLAATALVENMGEELRLRKTPRVLTVKGDLRAVTGKYLNDSGEVKTEQLLKEEDEDDAFFDKFFTEQLGAGYEEEFVLNDGDDEAERLFDMFNVPGLGTEQDNDDAIKQMLDGMGSEGDDAGDDEKEITIANKEGTKSLPLFPFTSPEGKSYAFVQLVENPLLVGKEDDSIDESQRLLLDVDEAAAIIPRIEEKFDKELRDAGFLQSEE
eukprot:CAMPEP_0178520268 /NCGR_PEP_ID=MMETSP0696-20121128/27304_1 /TAXON_ID=265572 /ORGANISM="Extubocellulus spinifer, Strain CCMP396" /LENGTH=394 /DNA_ID=CAMNT_0020151095 /DNA_START=62 /DNA_END=1246 /DNA_ORIENTATION=+